MPKLLLHDIINAAIDRSGNTSSRGSVPRLRPARTRPPAEFSRSMKEHDCTLLHVKRKSRTGKVATSTRLLKKAVPFSGVLSGFRACGCNKRPCEVKDNAHSQDFWDETITAYRSAVDGDVFLKDWILRGAHHQCMCKHGMATMLHINVRIVRRCWPTPVQTRPQWDESDMPQVSNTPTMPRSLVLHVPSMCVHAI